MTNIPGALSLSKECKKAARILKEFRTPEEPKSPGLPLGAHSLIPHDVIEGCLGVVVLSVAKGAFLFGGRVASGIVIVRLPSGCKLLLLTSKIKKEAK